MVAPFLTQWIKNKLFSLSGYIVLAVICIHIFLLPVLYFTLLDSYLENSHEQFINHNTALSGMLSDVISTKSISDSREEIFSILESSALGGNILYLDIVNKNNKSYQKNKNTPESVEFIEDIRINEHNDNVFYIRFPVYFRNDKNNISYLHIGFDESTLSSEYKSIKYTIALILLIYFSVVLALIASMVKVIHKPIHLLRDQSKEIVKGNLGLPLTNPTRLKEIRYLSNDLENMRKSLVNLAERMQYKATHDELTDLPNRYLFNDRLKQCTAISGREKKEFAILLLDLDRFKEINDTLGHGVGDEVLKVVSRRMLLGLRDSDTIARIGGDEFSFILMNINQIVAEKIASKIIEAIEPTFEVKDHSLKVGASIGISIYPQDGDNPELLMRRADVAMYNAKNNHLQVSSYCPEMDSDHYEKLILSNDLRDNITNGCFEPLFQSKVNLITGKICGCELLLRWNHPNLGLINPDKFIPLAERENLIGDLTRWVISSHLHDFIDIVKKDKYFHVAINVSPIDLLNTVLFESISEILEQSQFPKSNLYIEVTENAIMKNPARSVEILNMFSNEGIIVSIDDFGTGYSSLSYLQKFPISELKIDKSFICNLSKDSNNYPIVMATITMAHDLGITVVAEGVEDKSIIDLLIEMGCDRAQGYYFSYPLKINEFKKLL